MVCIGYREQATGDRKKKIAKIAGIHGALHG